MGIDAAALQLLYAAEAAGVDFASTATIGQQQFFPDPRVMTPIIEAFRGAGAAKGLLEDCSVEALTGGGRFLESLGAKSVVSFDASDYEGADVLHDMNRPLPAEHCERYGVVFDGGSVEHIFHATQAYQNCLEMVRPGGYYLVVTTANNMLGHGFYQFSPEFFFRTLTEANGYRLLSVLLCRHRDHPPRFYSVRDPAAIGGRVELVNQEPVYLFAVARRERVVPLFAETPQQSDYRAAWENGGDTLPAGSGLAPIPLGKQVEVAFRRGVRDPLRRLFYSFGVPSPEGFSQPCFRSVTLQEMTRGVLS